MPIVQDVFSSFSAVGEQQTKLLKKSIGEENLNLLLVFLDAEGSFATFEPGS